MCYACTQRERKTTNATWKALLAKTLNSKLNKQQDYDNTCELN